ncbi:NlpC/P60 family protein [Streptomyces sp. NPDC056160]|uniref:NlpC/P60 family protein n=1 Tax=Streptomyces sp. NPDC056160 TaxID=3345731 RepID=UPI0035DB0D7D
MQNGASTPVPLTDALPGDLVFFQGSTGHVGVYAGDGIMIHVPRPGARVRAEPVPRAGAPGNHSVVRPAWPAPLPASPRRTARDRPRSGSPAGRSRAPAGTLPADGFAYRHACPGAHDVPGF